MRHGAVARKLHLAAFFGVDTVPLQECRQEEEDLHGRQRFSGTHSFSCNKPEGAKKISFEEDSDQQQDTHCSMFPQGELLRDTYRVSPMDYALQQRCDRNACSSLARILLFQASILVGLHSVKFDVEVC